ncbi:MAG: HEPN domain-containing protein, partial [Okeania sp. SIO4D6]|nr:HEPN domain-containing protein [Okeania sp. SIO4D6]
MQLGASRCRLEDARALHSQKRWNGAVYMSGYAIECALKSLICYQERTNNFKDTTVFKQGLRGSKLHSLVKLLDALPNIQRVIEYPQRNNPYRQAWITVTSSWKNDELRYSNRMGDETEAN